MQTFWIVVFVAAVLVGLAMCSLEVRSFLALAWQALNDFRRDRRNRMK